MDRFEEFFRRRLTFTLYVVYLAADHSSDRAGSCRQLVGQRNAPFGRYSTCAQHLKGERQKSVAGENRHRVAENFVTSRTATAQIVVIERRQIVVNQRIRMDQLQRTGSVLERFAIALLPPARPHTQHRPYPLPACEQTVPHRFVDILRRFGFGRNPAIQRSFHELALLLQIVVDHAFGGLKGSASHRSTPRQHLYACLRFFELLAACLADLHALFEQFQRLIERQIAGLELLYYRLQFCESSLEAGHRFRIFRHYFYSTLADVWD